MSQLDLAGEAEVSSRHLSFVETGRANPSRDMVLRLAERLEVPMRERNVLLVAAGYAPVFPESDLTSPELTAVREAVDIILEGHKPYPAFALDRHWNIVASNNALPQLYDGVDPALLTRPVNVIRLSLHPNGLAPRIANLGEWRAHALSRLRRQIELTADPVLIELMADMKSYSAWLSRRAPAAASPAPDRDPGAVPRPARRPGAVVLHHHLGVRHAAGGQPVRTGGGVVLPGRRGNRGDGADFVGLTFQVIASIPTPGHPSRHQR